MSEQTELYESLLRQFQAAERDCQTLLAAKDASDREVADLREELAAVREELESNRACNLYTWKEQFQKAEASLSSLRSQLATLEQEAKRAKSEIETAYIHSDPRVIGRHIFEAGRILADLLSQLHRSQP